MPAACDSTLKLVHEDAHLLVLDKPSGLLCVPGRGADKEDSLSSRAAARWPGALVVHRLDMATSGLVVMARSPDAQRKLGDAFARREVYKRYEAIVEGLLPVAFDWSLIDAPLMADWPRRPLQKIDPAGKPSQTRWRAERRLPKLEATWLALEPLTGRSHQLRVHLQSIGHPILGDALYGSHAMNAQANAATEATTAAEAPPPAARLMLHATVLAFAHPQTGEACRFESPPPFEFSP
ncbi:Ribosomal large subunit pseudouridine synthase A [Burkholderiales bacterium 8X]|nr:Ribosomal large subunit pseudouridine synthase A [Burkholderiales bacterium 8X]